MSDELSPKMDQVTSQPFEFDRNRPDESVKGGKQNPWLNLVLAAIIFVAGMYLTSVAIGSEKDELKEIVRTLQPIWAISLAAAVVALVAGVTSSRTFYPLIIFVLLTRIVQSVYTVVWNSLVSYSDLNLERTLQPFGFLAITGGFSMLFGLILFASSVLKLVRRRTWDGVASLVPKMVTLSAKELKERARIKTYFSPVPKWPTFLAGISIAFAVLVLLSPYDAMTKYYTLWSTVVQVLLVLALYRFVSNDGKTIRFLDPAVFITAISISHSIHSFVSFRWLAPTYGENFFSEVWPIYVYRLFVAVALVSLVYALFYRLFVYRRWRRSSDSEVDAVAIRDAHLIVDHALVQLGIDRLSLITPPMKLLGIPDRESVSGAFIGSRIGKDDVLRFTPQRTTIMAFTDDQIHFYEGTLDLTTGRVIHESIVELFYQDISSVARENGTQSIGLKQAWSLLQSLLSLFSKRKTVRRERIKYLAVGDTVQFEGKDVFQINLEIGRALVVVLKDASFFDTKSKRIIGILRNLIPGSARVLRAPGLYNSELPHDENERVIRVIRSLIQDKKRALLHEST